MNLVKISLKKCSKLKKIIFLPYFLKKCPKLKKTGFMPDFQVAATPNTSRIGSNRELGIFLNMYRAGNHCVDLSIVLASRGFVNYVQRLKFPLKRLKIRNGK